MSAVDSVAAPLGGTPAPPRQPRLPPFVVGAYAALFVNGLTFLDTPVLLPIPHVVGQLITQGCLVAAFILAIAANPRWAVRPRLVLVLLTMLALVSVMVALHSQFPMGSTYRAVRLLGFVLTLWLLTPWWGRDAMVLLRIHLGCLWVVLASVVVGAVVDPGDAFALDGRLAGALWPVPATQVAHYAAVVLGVTSVLWLTRTVSTRRAVVALAITLPMLLMTHTRTAILALVVGLVVAGASLFLGHARVRRTSAVGVVGAVVLAAIFARELTEWALRGQSTEEAGQLTGRTKVWSAVVAQHRPRLEGIFGSGLSDQSFDGLPIDSTWVSAYLDQGWFGVVVHASVALVILTMALVHRRGPRRAVALFLLAYALAASGTESTVVSASAYVLELIVAAALLSPGADRRRG